MTIDRHTLELAGCAPIPLAHYLKALAVLRLVSEQVDQEARGWWEGDAFWLRSTLDREQLVEFFLERYEPTPLVGPWGARSGFFAAAPERAAREALDSIAASDSDRLATFRNAIDAVRGVLGRLGLQTKAGTDEEKLRLMTACRAMFPDSLLQWLDATYVLLNNDRGFPPLLGTGGNEGSGSYMSGFAQQVVAVIVDRRWDNALHSSLFALSQSNVTCDQAPGHFSPEATGGPNASSGFDGAVEMNPWDYLLGLEGTLLFAASAVKKLEDHSAGSLAYPFCVRPVAVGYGSATLSDAETTRAEMWFPLWSRATSYDELRAFLSEGRAVVNRRTARDGIDFARAVASVGIDRGVDAFERYGFQQRNGLSYFAVPLGRWYVERRPRSDLLDEFDDWYDRFRRTAMSKNAPSRAGRALHHLETAILGLCKRGQPRDVQEVLIALGEAEAAVAVSPRLRDPKTGINPVPWLSADWVASAQDSSVEYRLAAALAGIGCEKSDPVGSFRRHLEPIDPRTWNSRWPKWSDSANDPGLVWGGGGLVRNTTAVLSRRMIEVIRHGEQPGDEDEKLLFPSKGRYCASLGDISAFIDGDVDDDRIERLLRGLLLVNWRYVGHDTLKRLGGNGEPIPDASYALLKLCHLPHKLDDKAVPLAPAITRRAAAGDIAEATLLAARRLRGSGIVPAVETIPCRGERARRTAAALLFPVRQSDIVRLAQRVIRRTEASESDQEAEEAAAGASAVS